MKKYSYLSKSKKLLLSAMTVPIIVSALPVTENVFANENEIPTLNVYINENGIPKLEWATEILQENILTKTSFEEGELRPDLNRVSSKYNYLHEISSNGSYSGNYGYLLNDNSDGKGNYVSRNAVSSNNHLLSFGTLYFENGIPLSMTFKAKSIGTSSIYPWGDGGQANKIIILPNKLVKNAKKGDKVLYLDSVEGLNNSANYNFDTDDYGEIRSYKINSINKENNSIVLSGSLNKDLEVGQDMQIRNWRQAFTFNKRVMTDTDWQTYSINTIVNDFNDYDVLTRGAIFYLTVATNGQLMIDDIQFGHATEVEVYRDNKSIYKGYLSDFEDKSAKDNLKPNFVSEMHTSLTKDKNINFIPKKPSDQSKTISYTIQAVAKNGTRSNMSEPKIVETATGVQKYKYTINQSEKAPSSLSTLTNGLDFDIELSSLNLQKDYIHIQSIDGNGNVSTIQTFKIDDIVDSSLLKESYNKMDELEKSNDYTDFIDFVDEIKTLYGSNIPKDLKERLNELANYHGMNTSFLLLEEGDFRLSTTDINDFGEVKLTAKKQTLTTSFKNDFGVIDARGTQEGWHITVSATPFEVETFDGFIGTPHQLPMGSLALNILTSIKQVGTVHNSQLPNITLNQLSTIDSSSHTIQLLNADKNKGMGEFKFSFAPDALNLTVDAVTSKIDTVNYPNQNTPYKSTVTWDLISGPIN